MGRTSYLGNSGMHTFNTDTGNTAYSKGPFHVDSTTRMQDIIDGRSNTIAFGEALGGPEIGAKVYAFTWLGSGVMTSYWDCQSPSTYFTFSSHHSGVVNFAFCDGSVRPITKVAASPGDSATTVPAARGTTRWDVFQQVSGVADGKIGDWNVLGLEP